MAHKVICFYCRQPFDADKESFVKPNNTRYAHAACHEKAQAAISEEDKAKTDLEDYIKFIFKTDTINAKIRRQIKMYLTESNYTYSGILSTFMYVIEVKHNDVEKMNDGIGIVGFMYQEAWRYNYNLWLNRQRNEHKIIDDYRPQETKIVILPPERKPIGKKKFAFLDEEEVELNEQ